VYVVLALKTQITSYSTAQFIPIEPRNILKHKLNWIPNLTSEILLNGTPELHSDLNVQIVKAVHSYILATKRAL
jgi:hypothetical protein